MLLLEKNTVAQYLATHYPRFDQSQGIQIREIGGPMEEAQEDDAAGFVNLLFRVSNSQTSLIVKQGQENMRIDERIKLPSSRNRFEYETLQLRQTIVPQYIPTPYYHDPENAIFLMEDVSHLGSVRYQLDHSAKLPNLARQVGEFVATNAFYTSELHIETDQFRRLTAHFRNSEMRDIMETWVFLRKMGNEDPTNPLSPHSQTLAQLVECNEDIRVRTYALRHKFMSHTECFIHGDLHISNMFANQNQLKVIDMEYTFAGPYCYDLGYFLNSLLGEYSATCFRPYESEIARADYLSYLVESICTAYNTFVAQFSAHWKADAKPVYRQETAYLKNLTDRFLPDVLGYASLPTLGQHHYRVVSTFSRLALEESKKAQELCTLLSQHFLLQGYRFHSIEEAVASMVQLTQTYCQGLN